MSHHMKIFLFMILMFVVPAGMFAQSDICSTLPTVSPAGGQNGVPGEVIVEQMRQRASAQTAQEAQRANWISKMITMKNNVPTSTLQALCIFHAEVVPQSTLHVLSIRAPKELMSAIEDAVMRLDTPQAGLKSVELTVHVLVASDQDETLRPVPASLKPVVDQLKTVLTYKQFFLVDTLLGTLIDRSKVYLNGDIRGLRMSNTTPALPLDTSYQFQANLSIENADQSSALVRLSGLIFSMGSISISTQVDVPPGKQVVVGKTTMADRSFILVVSAKILN